VDARREWLHGGGEQGVDVALEDTWKLSCRWDGEVILPTGEFQSRRAAFPGAKGAGFTPCRSSAIDQVDLRFDGITLKSRFVSEKCQKGMLRRV